MCRAVATRGPLVPEGDDGKVRAVEGVGLALLSFRREFLGFERGVKVSTADGRRGDVAVVVECVALRYTDEGSLPPAVGTPR